MIYGLLFWEFFKVGIFCVGGGYASMPLIQASVVDTFHWLTMSEFVDIFTISQMTPGPIAVNSATFVGIRIGGVAGRWRRRSGASSRPAFSGICIYHHLASSTMKFELSIPLYRQEKNGRLWDYV